MGVLPCDRAGCENVMCDRLSDEYGYICYDCFDELLAEYARDSRMSIAKFMGQESRAEIDEDRAYDILSAEFKFR